MATSKTKMAQERGRGEGKRIYMRQIDQISDWVNDRMSEWAAEQIYTWLFDTCRRQGSVALSFLTFVAHSSSEFGQRASERARRGRVVREGWLQVKLLLLGTETGRVREKRERGEAEMRQKRETYRGEDRSQLYYDDLIAHNSLCLSPSLSSGVTPRSCSCCCSEPLRIFLLLFIYLSFYLLYH